MSFTKKNLNRTQNHANKCPILPTHYPLKPGQYGKDVCLYGFRKNGIDKLTYTYGCGSPWYFGREIAMFCAVYSIGEMSNIFDKIETVDGRDYPTEEQLRNYVSFGRNYCCIPYEDLKVDPGAKNWDEWIGENNRELLSVWNLSDEYRKILYMRDDQNLIKNSLYCEYAYIIDLDKKVLEMYYGYQQVSQPGNRYGEVKNDDGYYPCKLVLEIPLKEIAPVNDTVSKMTDVCHQEREYSDVFNNPFWRCTV